MPGTLEKTVTEMKTIFGDDLRRIKHALEVLKHSLSICDGESPDGSVRSVVELAAVLHDIGIKQAELLYNSTAPVYQHREGPPIAKKVLEKVGVDNKTTARILFIIGNHHHKSKINGTDFQILWEADLLTNLPEFPVFAGDYNRFQKMVDLNFKTRTGKELALSMRRHDHT